MILSLQLLGGLQARWNEEPLGGRAAQRKRLALLALLGAASTRAVSRDRVVALLWPEHDSARARHQLAAAAHDLRCATGPELLVVDGDELRLNPDWVSCDLWSFESALKAAQPHLAVEHYGGPLLDGFHLGAVPEFQQWVDGERDRLARRYATALEAAAARSAAGGDPQASVEWWRRRAAHDPYDSRVAIALMRALAAAGNPAAAIRHARAHSALVRKEFDTEPNAEIVRLSERLHTSELVPIAPPHVTVEVGPSALVHDADGSVTPETLLPASDAGRHSPPAPASSQAAAPRRRRGVGVAATMAAVITLVAFATSRPANSTAAVRRYQPDPPARALYLRGRVAWNKRTKAGLDEAVVRYREATERDPGYAAAFAGLAESYVMLGYFGFVPADAAFPKADAAAHRALELDPASGDAEAALAQVLAWKHRWVEAETAAVRGIRAEPNNPTTHQWYGLLLAYLGRPREAVAQTAIASGLDPLSLQINNMYGMMLYHAGDLDGALRQYERTVNAEPDSAWVRSNPWVLSNYGAVAAAAGLHAQAVGLIERALDVVPTHPRPLLDLATAYIRVGKPDSARLVFARADTTNPQYPVHRALLQVKLGAFDQAFASFDRINDWPLASLVGLSSSPDFAAFRADPRFQKIRARLGMPPTVRPNAKR